MTIVGGGPAGLIAAWVIARHGVKVDIYDGQPTMGRKFLMAGRGGLNLTHSETIERFLGRYGGASDWLSPMVDAFGPDHLRQFVHDLGQETFVGTSGRVFPRCFKASPLLRVWLKRLVDMGVTFHPRHRWIGGDQQSGMKFEHGGGVKTVTTDNVLLCLGGGSWPRLGSDGGWVTPLRLAGVPIAPLVASNCAVNVDWTEHMCSRFAGMPLKRIGLGLAGARIRSEVVITSAGLEGTGIYALSSEIRNQLDKDGVAILEIDLVPDRSIDDLEHILAEDRRKKSLSTFLTRRLKLSPQAIALAHEGYSAALGQVNAKQLAHCLKLIPVTITGLANMDRAISTAGGIMRNGVDDQLMLHALPGVFVAGEMLDYDAPTGGYLLQAAFSTGCWAAHGIIARMRGGSSPLNLGA